MLDTEAKRNHGKTKILLDEYLLFYLFVLGQIKSVECTVPWLTEAESLCLKAYPCCTV